jgi:hypothetical protein
MKTQKLMSQRLYEGNAWRVTVLFLLPMLAKYILGGFVMLFVLVNQSPAQVKSGQGVFCDGEVLQYRVRWGFIRLGTLTLRQDRIDSSRYVCTLVAESNPSVPFVDIFFVNRSIIAPPVLTGEEFITAIGRTSSRVVYHWRDLANGRVLFEETLRGEVTRRDTIETEHEIYDELGMILSARTLAGTGTRKTFHASMEYNITQTEMRFPQDRETIDVPAFQGRIPAYRFEVKAGWTRPDYAGLKGDFEGWISDDDAAVLLRADLKILVGSVVVELESFERPGWNYGAVRFVNASH